MDDLWNEQEEERWQQDHNVKKKQPAQQHKVRQYPWSKHAWKNTTVKTFKNLKN